MSSKNFRSDVLSGTFGTIVAYIIGFATLPLITHFYKPEHIGTWQILFGLVSLLTPVATLRFEDALVLEKSKKVIARLLSVVIINTCIIVILLLIASLLIGSEELTIVNLKINQSLLVMAVIGVIMQVGFLIFNALIIKDKKFKIQAISKILGSIAIPTIALVALLLTNASKQTYIIAALAALFFQSIILFIFTNKQYFVSVFKWNKNKTKKAIKKYRVYPAYMVPYALSQGFIWQVTLLMLGILFSTSTVGAYTVARQLVFMPVSLLTTGLKQVVFSYASTAPKYDKTVNKRIRFLLKNLINLIIPLGVFSFFYISDIINYVLGEDWEQVGVFSKWIMIPAIALMLTSWLDRIFDVYGKQKLAVLLQVTSDVVLLILLAFCYFFKADAQTVVITISLFLTIYNIIWLFIVLFILKFETSFWGNLLFRITTIAVTFFFFMMLLDATLTNSFALTLKLLILALSSYYTFSKMRTHNK